MAKPPQGCCVNTWAFPLRAACSGTTCALLLFCIACTPAGSKLKVFSVVCECKEGFFQQKALSGSHCSCNQCVDNTEENLAGLQSVCNAIAPVLPPLKLLLLSSSSKSCQSRWIWIQKYLPLLLPYSLTGRSVCSSGMQDGSPGPRGRWVPGRPRGCSRFSLQGKQERAASINFLPPSPYKRAGSQAERCTFSKLCKTSRVQGAAQI